MNRFLVFVPYVYSDASKVRREEGYSSMHKRNWNIEAKGEMIDLLTLIGFGPEWRRQSRRCCFVLLLKT